ncbi:AMP-binding protein [Gilvimarinus sp. F26214L]|uniref:AMP-binding protein n=1 Tax=Gilvimarinus sp. DZF01 TaxID=3461371 RepID=UPI004045F32D
MLGDNATVVDVFNESVKKYQNNRAFTCLGHTLSFADLDQLSARFAAYLQNETSLEPGDRIAIQLPNVLQYPVVLWGALRAGMVVVNTNPLYTAREVQHQLKDSGAKALVVLANVAAAAASVVADTEVEQVIVTEIADLHPPLKRLLINSVVKYVQKGVPSFSFPNQVPLNSALKTDAGLFQPVNRRPEDLAVLQYTGGTTGVAKGAMLTNANLVANKEQLSEHLKDIMREGENVTWVAPLPLYHIYAFTVHCMSIFSAGNHNLLIPNPRDLDSFVKALKGETIYGFVGLNTLFNALCQHEGFRKLDLSSLQFTSSGGMALTKDTARLWTEVTGVVPGEGYGLTETSPVVSANPPGGIQQGTVGTPVAETELKVIDEKGETLPTGEVGELCVRGPQVMKGYWNRPEETAKVLSEDGWFKTGDMAMVQDDGYLRIVDRKKDMILVSGFNVYPNEVEDILSEHPGILEAGAIGVPDEHSGEVVKAFVVCKDLNLTVDDVRAFAKKNMTAYKVPKIVEFVDSLPKSPVGKILRRELKEADQKKQA